MLRAIIVFVFAFLTTIACSDDKASPRMTPTANSPTASTQVQGSSTTEMLALSSERLLGVTSSRTDFEWRIGHPDFDLRGNGELVIVAPSGLHLTAYYRGEGGTLNEENSSELLVLDAMQAFIKTSAAVEAGWIIFTPQELGADWDVLQRLISARSPFDFVHIAGALPGRMEDRGEDKEGEAAYRHLRGTIDAGTLMNALADAYGSQGQTMLANRFTGPVTLDIWIDPITILPHKVIASGTFDLDGDMTDVQVSITYYDLNAALSLPTAPADAVPLSEAGG